VCELRPVQSVAPPSLSHRCSAVPRSVRVC
jgi:hypothetical protein